MKNFLVGIDLNEKTDELINKAQNLAREYGAKLWILHVASPITDFIGFDVTITYPAESYETIREGLLKQLQHYVDDTNKQGIEAEGILLEGAATEVIISESKKRRVDLIICGHHEHSVLYHMLFGSTSASVVRNSEIPVMVFPLKQADD